jgi:polyhydroxybutyrate depolymerase
MACDHADRIAAIVTIAGLQFKDISKCNPSERVSVLHIHGTGDTKISYDGGILLKRAFPSAAETVADWMSLNGCTANSLTNGTPFSIISTIAGAETTPAVATCPAGVSV